MATFEEIQKANSTIQTMGIERTNKKTGRIEVKEYAEVNQRIKAFRMVYPMGFIKTDIVSLEDGVVTMKAVVGVGEFILGTGYAQEKETSSYINRTSFIENCETSAVGRALGMCGFGIDTSVASFEEVANAIKNQDVQKATKDQIAFLRANCSQGELDRAVKKYGRLEDIPSDDVLKKIMAINKQKQKGFIDEEA